MPKVKFACSLCKREFASSRGLGTHERYCEAPPPRPLGGRFSTGGRVSTGPLTPRGQIVPKNLVTSGIADTSTPVRLSTPARPPPSTSTAKKIRSSPDTVSELLQIHEAEAEDNHPVRKVRPPTATWAPLYAWLCKALAKPAETEMLHLAVLNLQRCHSLWARKSVVEAFPIAAACIWTASKYLQGPNALEPDEIVRMMPRQYRIDAAEPRQGAY